MPKKLKKMRLLSLAFILVMVSSCTKDRFPAPKDENNNGGGNSENTLMYYWSFNNSSSITNLITADIAHGNYELSYNAVWDDVSEGSELNARNNAEPGSALRLRNPAGTFIIKVSTVGYKNISMKYAVTRTNNGAQENIISYSTNGTDFYTLGLDQNVVSVSPTDYTLYTFNFSAIPSLNNQADIYIRIEYNLGQTNPSGNNRVDNLTFEGTPL